MEFFDQWIEKGIITRLTVSHTTIPVAWKICVSLATLLRLQELDVCWSTKVGLDTRSYSVTKYFSFTFFFYVKELPGTLQISLGSDHAKLCWFSECCREGVRAYYIYQCSCTPPKGKEKVWISSECSCNSVSSYHFKMSNDFRNLKLALTNCR